VFNEGYLPKAGDEILRGELCEDAIFLTRLIVAELEKLGQEIAAEPRGLLALMVLTHSRRRARVAEDGLPVTLEEQDRSLWMDSEATEGLAILDRAIAARSPGPYQLKAAISALHHTATDTSDTDWEQIHTLYRELLTYEPTPVVRLNAIVALGMWQGPTVALEALGTTGAPDPTNPGGTRGREAETLASALEGYPYYDLAEARFLEELGRITEALAALRRAKDSTTNGAEQRFIDRRILELERRGG
jgi:RNA polymerase sigma-70 factor (ECF subfamily)